MRGTATVYWSGRGTTESPVSSVIRAPKGSRMQAGIRASGRAFLVLRVYARKEERTPRSTGGVTNRTSDGSRAVDEIPDGLKWLPLQPS